MMRTESRDSKVLRWGSFAMAAFVGLTMMMGLARADGDREHRRGKRQPPPVAFEACKSKKVDDACQVVFGERKIDGNCKAFEDGQLFCRPARPPGPPPARMDR